MTDDSMQDTGDPLGTIDLAAIGHMTIKDDGTPGSSVEVWAEWCDGNDGKMPPTSATARLYQCARDELGDEAFMDALAAAGSNGDGDSDTGWGRGPPDFKCAECNTSWARSANQNPGDGDDVCPECADDED